MIMPVRVEFKDGDKVQEVKLVNQGKEAGTYRISFQHLRMKEDGSYEEITETSPKGAEKFADDLIRYAPKRVVLKAGETQNIRLMLVKPKGAPGEYRSHLLLREELPPEPKKEAEANQKNISVSIRPVFGISIPVIVRYGKPSFKINIENVKMVTLDEKTKAKAVEVKITRAGNYSSRGNIIVNFTPKGSTTSKQIGVINSLYVFYPYPSRTIRVPIDKDANLKGGGMIEVKYMNAPEEGQVANEKDRPLAQKSLTVN